MSNMSFLEKLLDGVEVEWKTLGKVLIRTKGTKITAWRMREIHKEGAPVKIFAGGKTVAYVDLGDIPEKEVNSETSIIVKSRGVIEFEYYDKPFSHKNEMWSYNARGKAINIKYVYHFLKLNESHFQNIARKMQMPQIATPDTDNFQIPIPCPDNPKKSLEIQAEIVRILDTFTELTAELTARKKQYSYYRNQLLSFEDGDVEWKTLGEVFELRNGYTPSKANHDYWIDGDIPWFRMEDLRTNGNVLSDAVQYVHKSGIKGKLFLANSIIMATTATIGEHALVTVDYMSNQRFTNFTLKAEFRELLDMKFVYYYFFILDELAKQSVNSSSFPSVQMNELRKFLIPLPCPDNPKKSLEIQAEIVRILDKFDALTHSLTEGFPREIELRQKQYEYYRDLLLNFPKPQDVAA